MKKRISKVLELHCHVVTKPNDTITTQKCGLGSIILVIQKKIFQQLRLQTVLSYIFKARKILCLLWSKVPIFSSRYVIGLFFTSLLMSSLQKHGIKVFAESGPAMWKTPDPIQTQDPNINIPMGCRGCVAQSVAHP